MTRTRAIRLLIIVGQIALTGVVFWILSTRINFGSVLDHARSLPLWTFITIPVIMAAQLSLVACRLMFVTKTMAQEIPFPSALGLLFVGAFFAQTPLSILGGDVMKVWMLHRRGIAVSSAANIILLDRVYGILALLAVFLCVLVPFWFMLDSELLRFGSLGFVALGMLGIAVMMNLHHLPPHIRRFRLAEWVYDVGLSFSKIFIAPHMLAPTIGLGMAAHFLSIVLMFALFVGLNTDVTFGSVLVLAPFPLLASLLPLSIGGWGMREGATVLAFTAVGVAPEQSLAVSLIFGLVMLITSLPGGIIWFVMSRRQSTSMDDAQALGRD